MYSENLHEFDNVILLKPFHIAFDASLEINKEIVTGWLPMFECNTISANIAVRSV